MQIFQYNKKKFFFLYLAKIIQKKNQEKKIYRTKKKTNYSPFFV